MTKGAKIADWLFYSNAWIALNALAQVAQTHFLLSGQIRLTPVSGFAFFGTLFLYALHRLAGLNRLAPFSAQVRHKVVAERKGHLRVYAALGLTGALAFFLQFPFRLQWMLALPCLIALGYALPLGSSGKRLRDLHFLKIFLLAAVWAWITVWLPAAELQADDSRGVLLMWLERFAFIFALVIPFDIRDLEIDRHTGVKTIPGALGVKLSIFLAFLLLAAMMAFAALNNYSNGVLTGLAISAGISFLLILFARRVRHDYYFSGLLDGMMILQFWMVWALGGSKF